MRYGELWEDYRSRLYWWGSIKELRKLALIVVLVTMQVRRTCSFGLMADADKDMYFGLLAFNAPMHCLTFKLLPPTHTCLLRGSRCPPSPRKHVHDSPFTLKCETACLNPNPGMVETQTLAC